MNRFDQHVEYIVTQANYQVALNSLPATGTDGQLTHSVSVMTYEYRQNVSQTINAGKWTMWAVKPMPIAFSWQNNAWQPPANLVVRQD
ncbi:hypothetical protein J2I47_20555 [Fibrella sp. HMF5335]|uniref:Uncharacterized protein n=1 Tax=Fibrella rubiginis TaxID=2817060 RepID=A0A939GIJ9_9BACT|nr:hypothetical protein [Fibrella rubiginis]MBO0938956.1 hypothetical protein [Fibrella rubiginis]